MRFHIYIVRIFPSWHGLAGDEEKICAVLLHPKGSSGMQGGDSFYLLELPGEFG